MLNFNTPSNNSLDEIVFENRNKMYGAYALRKSYEDHLIKAFFISLATLFFIVFASFISKWITPPKPIVVNEFVVPFKPMTDFEIILDKSDAALPPKVSLQQKVPTESFTIAIDKKVIEENKEIKPIEGKASAGVTGIIGSPNAQLPSFPNLNKVGTVGIIPAALVPVMVDEMPEFPGGEEAMRDFLKSNIITPHEAEVAQITGSVLLSFIVETDGSISNVTVERGKGYGLDEEATRVIKQMPQWKPGIQKNQKVRVKFFLPIRFDY